MKQMKSRKHLKQPITRISANEEPGRWGFTCGHVVSLAEGRLCHGFQVAQVSLTFVQQWQQAMSAGLVCVSWKWQQVEMGC